MLMNRFFKYCVLSKLCLVLYAALLSACSGAIQTRPESWPQPANHSEPCPDISGSYDNMAEEPPYTEGKTGFLYDEFTNEGLWGNHTCEYCEVNIKWLDVNRQSFVITMTDYGNSFDKRIDPPRTLSKKFRLADGDYECRDGALIIDFLVVAEFVREGGVHTGLLYFEKAADGSLLRRLSFDTYGHIFFFIPVVFKTAIYNRWITHANAPSEKPLESKE